MSKEKQMFEDMAEAILEDYTRAYSRVDMDTLARYIRTKYDEYNAGYRKQGEWISVEERLPDVAQKVLLFSSSDGINLGYVTDDKRFYVYKSYPERPTHWIPLPEPPKGGAE